MTTQTAIYFKGDKAIFTGKTETLYGATWGEAKMIEGHKKGETVLIRIADKPPADHAEIKKFKAGQKYSTRSICDHNCIFSFTITKRTEKSVWIKGEGIKTPERRKIDIYDGSESIYPLGKYSMAPVLNAGR